MLPSWTLVVFELFGIFVKMVLHGTWCSGDDSSTQGVSQMFTTKTITSSFLHDTESSHFVYLKSLCGTWFRKYLIVWIHTWTAYGKWRQNTFDLTLPVLLISLVGRQSSYGSVCLASAKPQCLFCLSQQAT